MKQIQALEEWHGAGPELTLFLAGGIAGCWDWQASMVELLSDTDLVLLNPRRTTWSIDVPTASAPQITWEHQHLLRANAILFWFPAETLCPSGLYTLGAWNHRPKKLFIGCEPWYRQKRVVAYQTYLERPSLEIVDNLTALAAQVKAWAAKKAQNLFHRDGDQPVCDVVGA